MKMKPFDEALIQQKLFHLISKEGLKMERIISALERLEKQYGIEVYRILLFLTAHLDFSSRYAKQQWQNIGKRYHEIFKKIRRPIDFRVALLDYFTYEKKIKSPTIIEIKIFQKTIESSVIDELTKLYNYRFFLNALRKEFKRAERYGNRFSLIMFDLDDFKPYNDRYGHLAGNTALKRIAKTIQRSVREIDIVCRYGGEEFAIILPQTDKEGALVMAERIREKVEKMRFVSAGKKEKTPVLTLSGGISWYSSARKSCSRILKEADTALYIAKSRGKNNIIIYSVER